ncbi:MAG TPA: hypothetical protein VFI28_01240 [Candidatus Limnocylindrales bacterium]|nr:hypothetical protein [Candidatus Limnocylindrales bacterium]
MTNEYAHRNPNAAGAVRDAVFEVTSGSLFARNGAWWTGVPDDVSPGPASARGTDSAVFRMTTRRSDFDSVRVSFGLRVAAFVTTARTPAEAWDGVHVLLRYQSPFELYYASIDRRDGSLQIKKKVAGGASNGGTYFTLASRAPAVPAPGPRATVDGWQDVAATVETEPSGAVRIAVWHGAQLVLQAIDDGSVGGPPILEPGAVGIRGDNCDFEFRRFRVDGLHGDAGGLELAAPTG